MHNLTQAGPVSQEHHDYAIAGQGEAGSLGSDIVAHQGQEVPEVEDAYLSA